MKPNVSNVKKKGRTEYIMERQQGMFMFGAKNTLMTLNTKEIGHGC